ncbi:hypothetical protein BDR07DRAFT_1478429 [Suillus spraguei]|nr:hypothetical protein BDR07DRAFT_1478429 [Suillus spraguei]
MSLAAPSLELLPPGVQSDAQPKTYGEYLARYRVDTLPAWVLGLGERRIYRTNNRKLKVNALSDIECTTYLLRYQH